jgi:Ca2+/Na+ antiporter
MIVGVMAVVLFTNGGSSNDLNVGRRLSGTDPKEHLLGGCDGPKGLMGLMYVFVMGYAFLGLAVVCDDFFCSALESLSAYFKLSDDVAGATFMAAGSSAPELFTAMVDTFYFKSNVGLGTIIGSAIFNILVIIAASAAFSEAALQIDWRPLARDILFYLVSIFLLMGFSTSAGEGIGFSWPSESSKHGDLTWEEGLILMAWYLLYILFMCFNERILGPMGEKEEEENTISATDTAAIELTNVERELEEGASPGGNEFKPEPHANHITEGMTPKVVWLALILLSTLHSYCTHTALLNYL